MSESHRVVIDEEIPGSDRVAIVGSRDFANLALVNLVVSRLAEGCTVVSGGARGVDKAAAVAAKRRGLQVLEFIPDWDRDGKAAGFLRNSLIVGNCDVLIAFWDGKSRGTADAIRKAQAAGKPVDVRR